jgi:hypothetical protein
VNTSSGSSVWMCTLSSSAARITTSESPFSRSTARTASASGIFAPRTSASVQKR